MQVWISVYSHKYGDDVAVYATSDLAEAARAAVANEWWDNEMDGAKKPADPIEAADAYFDKMDEIGREHFKIFDKEVIE